MYVHVSCHTGEYVLWCMREAITAQLHAHATNVVHVHSALRADTEVVRNKQC